MRAVRGYEEKDPAITGQLTSGYPRFVVHPFARQLGRHYSQTKGLSNRTLWLVSSSGMAHELVAHLGAAAGAKVFADGDIHGVTHPLSPELFSQSKTFLQNIGGFISSRAAEDQLARLGLVSGVVPETLFAGDATGEIKRHLAPSFPEAETDDIVLANCGMNAVYNAFRALSGLQAARGRTVWIQLGWLYLDTIAILKKFTATPADYLYIHDVFDVPALEKIFAQQGNRIAGIIAEVPTNPLIQTPDIRRISALAREHGAAVVIDPSIASIRSLNLLPHADLIAGSLTKYTASEGDLVAGLVVINPSAADADTLRVAIKATIEPLYERDARRLALEIANTDRVLTRIQKSLPEVVAWLGSHPKVKDVFWALHPASKANYLALARSPDAVGAMVSFSLRTALEPFYDRLTLPKGPSFGMTTTLICPFMYLAHYDLVTTEEGRAELLKSGIDPDLLRLSVGCEPIEEIISSLADALA